MTQWIEIDPHDTLFFRDGRPFNQDEHGANRAYSLFPPSPRTTAMMMRAALARGQGWPGPISGGWTKQSWKGKPENFVKILGGTQDNIGKLECKSPRLKYKARDGSEEILYPVPLALVGKFDEAGKVEAMTRLIPGKAIRCDGGKKCDDGKIRLPVLPEGEDGGGWKALEDFYITQRGMESFLKNEEVRTDTLISFEKLFQPENRIGIERDNSTRTTKKGMLYETDHIRLSPQAAVVAGFDITQDGENWQVGGYQPFGGEGRFISLEAIKGLPEISAPYPVVAGDEVCYTVTLLSPMNTDQPPFEKPDSSLPGDLVSACIGKPVHYGGWCSVDNRPLTLKPYLPAGTVWFMKAPKQDFKDWQKIKTIGAETAFGFGEFVIGNWDEQEKSV